MARVLIIVGAPIGRFDHRAARIVARVDHRLGLGSAMALGTMDFTSAVRHTRDTRTTGLRLRNGATLEADEVGAVLNLVRFPELSVTDLLHTMQCRVINGLDGHDRRGPGSPELWPMFARRCGLAIAERGIATGTQLLSQRVNSLVSSPATAGPMVSATTTVTVVGDRVLGARSPCTPASVAASPDSSDANSSVSRSTPVQHISSARPIRFLRWMVTSPMRSPLLCDRAGCNVIAVAG